VSRATVGQLEAGDIGRTCLDTIERVAGVLEIRLSVIARWRGGDLDRQVNARHAALSELVARHLSDAGWTVLPQVSFSIWGERGVIDLVAWHEATRSLLVIELKTEVVDVEETVGTLDRKRRLATEIVAERGWRPRSVSVWLVVADSSMNRRRVTAYDTMLRAAYPLDGWAMRRWLRAPDGHAVAGLSFWARGAGVASNAAGSGLRRSLAARKRVRPPRSDAPHARAASASPPPTGRTTETSV
jgi:Holliday junction resolvase-like predicted endonuclease